ncbi:PAP2 family protein [Pseudanabaena sp. lw0831]|uniref:phosphatase PAP2 family protein n=1 Tax=Pseudanabaena sp. lw0831 TaxID=1357935 RepID=UPI001916B2BF|nr:PAP2 family protein [Pseudanabaena sp. lw0831]
MNLNVARRFFYFLCINTCFFLYPVLNQGNQVIHILKLSIDSWIPFIPFFSIFYILYIPFLFVTLLYFMFFSRNFSHAGFSFVFCFLISFLFYAFYQTTIIRPSITEIDFFSNVVLFIYANDKPYNCFPSLHVSLSILSFLLWQKSFPKVKIIMGTFVFLIILSTVLIKQHHTPDVIGGIILSITSFYFGQLFEIKIAASNHLIKRDPLR